MPPSLGPTIQSAPVRLQSLDGFPEHAMQIVALEIAQDVDGACLEGERCQRGEIGGVQRVQRAQMLGLCQALHLLHLGQIIADGPDLAGGGLRGPIGDQFGRDAQREQALPKPDLDVAAQQARAG